MKKVIYYIWYKIIGFPFRLLPLKNNRIVLENYFGKGYGDNSKYIANELLKNLKKYDLIWLVKGNYYEDIPKEIKQIKRGTLSELYYISTAKIWIDNSRKPLGTTKRKGQFYIQTWHGCLALKKIEYDAIDKLSDDYKAVIKNDNKMIDLMLSNSNFCDEMYKRAFKYNGKILKYGSPRNDILINRTSEFKEKIQKKYLIEDNNILLYAPTFRNSYEYNPYDIDFDLLKEKLEEKTGTNWKILIKLHPNISNNSKKYINSKDCIDASSYPDIQELICACDLLITDYSSTMFETMIANKPVIIYANDIDSYADERGFYFKFDELPFPLTRNNKELLNYIENNNIKDIPNNYIEFNKKIGLKETGQASKKVVEEILKEVESK